MVDRCGLRSYFQSFSKSIQRREGVPNQDDLLAYYYILLMSESRVSQLLRGSRSRHQIVENKELKKVSADYQVERLKSREAEEDLRKMISEMRYFQSLNKRLEKGVTYKRKELNQVKSIRERYAKDLKRKQRIEELRLQEIKRNKDLANRIKEERKKRIDAVKRSIFEKESIGDESRSQKQRLREERETLYKQQLNKNRNKVETIVEFECNLKESFVRKKESQNSQFIKFYRRAIQQNQKSIEMKRSHTEKIREKLKSLTEGTARRLSQMSELSTMIKRYKPTTPGGLSPITFNKQKLLQKSRCYTQTNTEYQKQNSRDNSSLFISQNHHHDL